LVRRTSEKWEVAERSDRPGDRDLADAALVGHFLELLSTFVADEKIESSNDSLLGLTPYRVEVRLRQASSGGKNPEVVLRFGNATSDGRIHFRRKDDDHAWAGRGGLALLLGNMQASDFFSSKMPYVGGYDAISGVEIEKRLDPGANRWAFRRDRNSGRWDSSSG